MDAYGHCVNFGMIMSRARRGVLTPGAQAHPDWPVSQSHARKSAMFPANRSVKDLEDMFCEGSTDLWLGS